MLLLSVDCPTGNKQKCTTNTRILLALFSQFAVYFEFQAANQCLEAIKYLVTGQTVRYDSPELHHVVTWTLR